METSIRAYPISCDGLMCNVDNKPDCKNIAEFEVFGTDLMVDNELPESVYLCHPCQKELLKGYKASK